MVFQDLLNWILTNCLLNFDYGGKHYVVGSDYVDNLIILAVNFGFWIILAFWFCFGIKFMKWCVRKCLRK